MPPPSSSRVCASCDLAKKNGDNKLKECFSCSRQYHLRACLNASESRAAVVEDRPDWACPDCVLCELCRKAGKDNSMLLCDGCDRGYHSYCMSDSTSIDDPRWLCPLCVRSRTARKRKHSESMQSPSKSSLSASPTKRSPLKTVETKTTGTPSPIKKSPSKTVETKAMIERRALNKRLAEQRSPRRSTGSAEEEGPAYELHELALPDDLALFQEAQKRLAADNKREAVMSPKTEKQICWVQIGDKELRAWYPSPYPDALAHSYRVYVCEFCLKCILTPTLLRRHTAKCPWRHPPGNEIYRDGNISFWEVDGKLSKVYCQNLCLLAKLFLDHKTLYFDVEPFLFYIMTETSATGCHMVGYFSKEKESLMNCNLSCLLTVPSFQRKGYGRLLIDFSYLLSRVEDKIGSPEHPLSDMGLLTYRNYWRDVIFEYLCKLSHGEGEQLSIKDLSAETGIHPNDIVSTLQFHKMMRYYKGKHIILAGAVEKYRKTERHQAAAHRRRIKPDCLQWRPSAHRETVEAA